LQFENKNLEETLYYTTFLLLNNLARNVCIPCESQDKI